MGQGEALVTDKILILLSTRNIFFFFKKFLGTLFAQALLETQGIKRQFKNGSSFQERKNYRHQKNHLDFTEFYHS